VTPRSCDRGHVHHLKWFMYATYPIPAQCRCRRNSRSPCMLNTHFHPGYRRFIFSVKGRCQYIKLHQLITAPESGLHRSAPIWRTKLPTISPMSSRLGISTLTWLRFFGHTVMGIIIRYFDSLLKFCSLPFRGTEIQCTENFLCQYECGVMRKSRPLLPQAGPIQRKFVFTSAPA
jgi:hypothetical protein